MSNYPCWVLHPEGPEYDDEPTPRPRCPYGHFISGQPKQFRRLVIHGYMHPDLDKWIKTDEDSTEVVWQYECKACGCTYDEPANWSK